MIGYKLIATIAVPLRSNAMFIGTSDPAIKEVADKACPHGYSFIESTYTRFLSRDGAEFQVFKVWAEVI